jgi:hypothetical protein
MSGIGDEGALALQREVESPEQVVEAIDEGAQFDRYAFGRIDRMQHLRGARA